MTGFQPPPTPQPPPPSPLLEPYNSSATYPASHKVSVFQLRSLSAGVECKLDDLRRFDGNQSQHKKVLVIEFPVNHSELLHVWLRGETSDSCEI